MLRIALFLSCTTDADSASNAQDSGCEQEPEIPYDGIDQDCDGEDLDDVDGDGYPAPADCDDEDATVHPTAAEVAYDGIDQDCDGEDLDDVDGDGWPVPDDCDDSDSLVHPEAVETCDGVDQDCDGETDEEAADSVAGWLDEDGDGYGGESIEACPEMAGLVYVPGDCDDANEAIHPNAAEVCANETDDNCDEYVDVMVAGSTHATVQGAIDAACSEGDTVWILPGTYTENVTLSRGLSVRATEDASNTILDGSACTGGGDCSVVSISGGDVALVGLAVTYGNAPKGGGVYASGGTVTIEGCEFKGNRADYGGALVADGASARVSNSTFSTNSAYASGGAIYIGNTTAGIEVDSSEFLTNTAATGGAIYVASSPPQTISITDSSFDGNQSGYGGAIAFGSALDLVFTGNTVTSNTCSNTSTCGGGVACSTAMNVGSGDVEVSGNTVSGNSPDDWSPDWETCHP